MQQYDEISIAVNLNYTVTTMLNHYILYLYGTLRVFAFIENKSAINKKGSCKFRLPLLMQINFNKCESHCCLKDSSCACGTALDLSWTQVVVEKSLRSHRQNCSRRLFFCDRQKHSGIFAPWWIPPLGMPYTAMPGGVTLGSAEGCHTSQCQRMSQAMPLGAVPNDSLCQFQVTLTG